VGDNNEKERFKATCLQIYAHFMKMFLIVKYCEVNKESNLHIVIGTYNQHKLPRRGSNMQKQPLLR
jgi:hypothetical protein